LENDPESGGIGDHIQRALNHAAEAIRCYFVLLAAEIERRFPRMLYYALWMVALVGFGLIGTALFTGGVARYLESRLNIPGVGGIIVGGVMVVVFLFTILRHKVKRDN
jgi:Mn2+/Fe2+ NRAMP family transporter